MSGANKDAGGGGDEPHHVDLEPIVPAIQDAIAQVKELQQDYDAGKLEAYNGVSFLELKNQVLLDYIANLTLLLNLKLRGKSIVGHDVVDRLVMLRVVMEKIKPLDKKLKYQIDKIVKLASSSDKQTDEDDEMQFKPNPTNLRPKEGTAEASAAADARASSSSAAAATTTDAASGVYQPPKIAAMPYTADDPAAIREEKRRERERQRMLHSQMMQDLRDQMSDRPQQIREYEAAQIAHLQGGRQSKKERQIQEYEEDNFLRLNVGKKQKKRSNPRNSLHDIADFRGFKGFNDAMKGFVTDVKRKSVREKMMEAQKTKRAKTHGRAK
ncbi:hypothetical protein PTSG_06405 [Salpingoeca rosetta]|uniref:Neuroguidin n=1 Tax=Salpingoeca rosetta (strain ATCC 50818 / BSB-021) TaxID=946362 RepID=F2UBX9_SALR5|nr:uncharacterized protein PTSG_06405 [Salpingoeca rosetta]EGD74394.1 hypothetical protein PTSG_06405 [Salpingoeca rosetta]|eukprot:XP_004993294.1 hypothetical protein PTSG_06405 [Salpingoeca rosetta]